MTAHILPDSRTHDRTKCSQMVDWALPSGKTVRLEAAMIYCGNCGCEYGYVPTENTSFCFYLCRQCFEQYGAVAGTCAVPDDEFNEALVFEMEERFGHVLSGTELAALASQGKLGMALELLSRESPFQT